MNFSQLAKMEGPDEYIHLKKWHIGAAGDHTSAIVLAHIFGWFTPNRSGQSKLSIKRDGREWMACTYTDWNSRLLIPERTMRRILKRLETKQLIVLSKFMWHGSETVHVSLNREKIVEMYVFYQKETDKNFLPEKEVPTAPAKMADSTRTERPTAPAKMADSYNAYTTHQLQPSTTQHTTPADKPPRLSVDGLKKLYGGHKYAEAAQIAISRKQKPDNLHYIAGILKNISDRERRITRNKLSPEQLREKLGIIADQIQYHYYDGKTHWVRGPVSLRDQVEKSGLKFVEAK